MNQQTLAEAKRVLRVVDDLIEDLTMIAYLPPYMSAVPPQDLVHLTAAFGGGQAGREVQAQLNDHFDLERRLESTGTSGAGDGMQQAQVAGAGASQEDIAEHHLSCRALLDTMRAAGFGLQYTPQFSANESVRNVTGIVKVLRHLLHDRCHTSVEDDVVKYTILHDTVNREKSASADVQALNREYHNEKESRRVEVEKRQQTIRKVQEEIQSLRQASEAELSNFLKLSRELATTNEERFKQEEDELHTKSKEMLQEKGNLESKYLAEEAALRAARAKKESTIAGTIAEYDSQMQNLTQIITSLQKEVDDDTTQLVDVERELNQLNQEAAEYELERKIAEQRKGHLMDVTAKLHQQARLIQAFFRSYAVRVRATQKGKKKGKKKD